MKKFIYHIFCLAFSLTLIGNFAAAQTDNNYGLDITAGQISAFSEQVKQTGTAQSFIETRAGTIISLILSFVGIIFLALVIYAGLSWMLAQGNAQKVEKAKDLIINAIIGLVIVFSAYAITNFIGTQISN